MGDSLAPSVVLELHLSPQSGNTARALREKHARKIKWQIGAVNPNSPQRPSTSIPNPLKSIQNPSEILPN